MSFLSPRIDLFKFTESGSGRVYRVTNSNKPAFIGNEEYTPVAITRTNVVHSEELEKTTQEITLPLTNEMARRWIFGASRDRVSVTLFEQKGSETNALWRGMLSEVSPGDTTIALKFDDIYSSLQKNGQGITYTRNCRHHLYSAQCGVSTKPVLSVKIGRITWTIPSPYVFSGTVSNVDGNIIALSHSPGENLTGGHLEAGDRSTSVIMKHEGNNLTLLAPNLFLSDPNNSKQVTLYVGCNKTIKQCKEKFDNVSNFGGFPWIPNVGIFDGTPIAKS